MQNSKMRNNLYESWLVSDSFLSIICLLQFRMFLSFLGKWAIFCWQY